MGKYKLLDWHIFKYTCDCSIKVTTILEYIQSAKKLLRGVIFSIYLSKLGGVVIQHLL